MKRIKIQSGTYQVAARMQFQVSSELRLRSPWLREELRTILDKKSHLLCHTINVEEIPTARCLYHYRITFAPMMKNSINTEITMSVDDILRALDEIEEKVFEAMNTRYLLSGLKDARPDAPKPGTAVPPRPKPNVI
jgi:hypothetical protein